MHDPLEIWRENQNPYAGISRYPRTQSQSYGVAGSSGYNNNNRLSLSQQTRPALSTATEEEITNYVHKIVVPSIDDQFSVYIIAKRRVQDKYGAEGVEVLNKFLDTYYPNSSLNKERITIKENEILSKKDISFTEKKSTIQIEKPDGLILDIEVVEISSVSDSREQYRPPVPKELIPETQEEKDYKIIEAANILISNMNYDREQTIRKLEDKAEISDLDWVVFWTSVAILIFFITNLVCPSPGWTTILLGLVLFAGTGFVANTVRRIFSAKKNILELKSQIQKKIYISDYC